MSLISLIIFRACIFSSAVNSEKSSLSISYNESLIFSNSIKAIVLSFSILPLDIILFVDLINEYTLFSTFSSSSITDLRSLAD